MTRWVGAAIVAVLMPSAVAAQTPAIDSTRLIRGIELRRFNIFSPAEAKSFLPRAANSLHVTTRSSVIRRELLFRTGAPFDSAQVAETARNLRGLGVFTSVVIDSARTDSGLVLRVATTDGWSTRPDFRFKSTGSSVVYTLAMEELNFLGTATLLGLRYRKNPDRSSVTALFRQPRLLAGNVGLGLSYEDRSDGKSGYFALSRPYFSLSGRTTWSASVEARRERILQFFDGADVARDTLERRYALGYATAGWALRAGARGYVRVGGIAQLRRDDYAAESRVDSLGRTLTGAVGGYLQWRQARYLVSRGLEGFQREQDIDVSTAVGLVLMATPRGFGYREDGVVPYLNVRTGFGRPTGFVQLTGTASGRFTTSGLDSGSVHLAGTAYFLPAPGHLATLHAAGGWQESAAPGAQFDLGLGVGPRAFRQHAFTGDRAFFTTGEYRWTAMNDFLKVTAIGLAGFVDYGGAWYHGAPVRTGWDFGLGLRFGFTRATDVSTTRVDFAYRVGNDRERGRLILVVGKGFAFSSNGRLDQ